MKKSKYLVRPDDFHIWELDESNGCYRSYSARGVTYPNGERPNADKYYTFKNLTKYYDFIPIKESELEYYENKHDEYCEFQTWRGRSDGHGGIKAGTFKEYLAQK